MKPRIVEGTAFASPAMNDNAFSRPIESIKFDQNVKNLYLLGFIIRH